jgi:predicted small lipoprotein YifL
VTGRSGRISAARLLVLALALTLALGGCGRKGDLRPPEGEEDAYSGLGVYPAPESVVRPESSPESSEEGAGGP